MKITTKISAVLLAICILFLIALCVMYIWETFTEELLQKMFLTDMLFIVVLIITTGASININENK